jgi:hypothetical protein
MGVKSFTQVFEAYSEFNYKDFKGKNVVIDASVEIYRSALGMKLSETLTDAFGNPTAHINIILLGVILKLKANGANQYWIFDYNSANDNKEEFHNPLKQLELQKRKAKRTEANAKLIELKKNLKKTKEQELFSDDDEESEKDEKDDTDKITKKISALKVQDNIDKQEKVAFVMKRFYTDDIIFILNMLDIPWIECPPGYDAEQIAAFATNTKDIFGVKMNYVLTPDADTLLFGAKKLIKRDIRKKKLFEYDLNDILTKHDLSLDDLIKIGLILGTDFAKKSPGIGPKTVLKKYKTIILANDQIEAMNNNFKKVLTKSELNNIVVNNGNTISFTDGAKYKLLLDWLQLVKNYNRARIVKQFVKNKLFETIE